MTTDRSQSRPRRMRAGLGTCLVAAMVVSMSLASPIASAQETRAGTAVAGIGSSCADPESITLGYGATILSETPVYHIQALGGFGPGLINSLVWYAPPGEIVCSTRIQLANGTVVPPTYIFPYPTPTPEGGQYDEPAEPLAHVSSVTITAAKPPIPEGRSCKLPIPSSLIDTIQHTRPKPDVLVKLVEISPLSLRLKLTPRKPNLVLCPTADFNVWLTGGRRLNFYLPVKPHGGLTPVITLPPDTEYQPGEATNPALIEAWAFARTVKSHG